MVEKEIELEENFDFNVLKEVLIPGLDSHISGEYNELGASDISLCARATLIKKIYGIKTELNNKMLFGKIYEAVLKIPTNLKFFFYNLHKRFKIIGELDPKLTYDEICNKEDYYELMPGWYIRLHPDIYTNLYTVEIKTTWSYEKTFTRELLPYQLAQENLYMGFYKHKLGFLHKINGRVFMNAITKEKEGYWETAWLKYGYFLPVYFDEALFKLSIQRFKYLFKKLDEKEYMDTQGPEEVWECKYCPDEVKAYCKSPITKMKLDVPEFCSACKKRINSKEMAYYRLEEPFCLECVDALKNYYLKE